MSLFNFSWDWMHTVLHLNAQCREDSSTAFKSAANVFVGMFFSDLNVLISKVIWCKKTHLMALNNLMVQSVSWGHCWLLHHNHYSSFLLFFFKWSKWPVSMEIWFMVSHSKTPVSDVTIRQLEGSNLKRALCKRLCGGSGGDSGRLLSEKFRKMAWDGGGKIYNHNHVNETRGTVAGSSERQISQQLEVPWWPEKEGLCFLMK